MPHADDAVVERFCQHVHALRAGDTARFVRFCAALGSVVHRETQDDEGHLVVRRRDGLTVGIACGQDLTGLITQTVLALFGPWGFSLGWVDAAMKRLQREETARLRQVRAQKREAQNATPPA